MKTQSTPQTESAFIGIDYHKRYSVYCVVDGQGKQLGNGRIDHVEPGQFVSLVRRWPGCRVVFEATMNWHWLLEILEAEMPRERIVLANSYKTRIIAEAQRSVQKASYRFRCNELCYCSHPAFARPSASAKEPRRRGPSRAARRHSAPALHSARCEYCRSQ